MGEVPEITDLRKVLEPHLPVGCTLESYKSCYLTKPGDNYGSIMLSIQAHIKRSNGLIKEFSFIAKLPPLTNDLYWQLFKPERTCLSENAVYQYLGPELEKLQLEAGVLPAQVFDGFPRYLGSRISLKEAAETVDRDAVLLQENLILRGYKPGNRLEPYNLAQTVLVMHYLAQYHALPIALRLKKPQIYDLKVRPYFKKFNMNDNMDADNVKTMNKQTLLDIEAISGGNQRDVDRVSELLEIFDAFHAAQDDQDGPFTTVVHGDLWINNLMLKYEDEDEECPSKLKIVDFQIAEYGSLVHDIIFLLFSSVDTTVLEDNYYNFLQMYYKEFIKSLNSVHVDTSNYTYEGFLDEVQRVAHVQIPHAIFMTKIIMADNSTIPEEYKDVDMSLLTKNTGVEQIKIKMSEILRLAKKFHIFY